MAIWNYAQRALKKLPAFWSSHTTAGFIPQRDNKEKDLYKNIYSCALYGGKKIRKWRGRCPLIGEWLNKLWWWNTIVLKGIINWRNSMWTRMTSRNWCRVKGALPGNVACRDWYTVVKSNVIDFCTSSNAMIQNNSEGLMRKNIIHIQRYNCGSINTEKQNKQKKTAWSHGLIGTWLGM